MSSEVGVPTPLFAVCLLIIFIIEFAVGITAASFKNEFRTALKSTMKNSLENYGNSRSDKIAWDNLQTKLECCGVDSPYDWKAIRPLSCCHKVRDKVSEPNPVHCTSALHGDEYLYNFGCFSELQMKAEKASKVLIGVGIGVAFIEIIGIILACWLASAVKKKQSVKA